MPAATAALVRTVDRGPPSSATASRISDADVMELARHALIIEEHYGRPMDIEWGKDGSDGRLYILQARPETVKSQRRPASSATSSRTLGAVLVTGRAIGQKIGAGPVRVVRSGRDGRGAAGRRAGGRHDRPELGAGDEARRAIVTNRGGRTCHAAIIARELGIPAVVGCGDATEKLPDGALVTVSCAEGDTGLSTTAGSSSRSRGASAARCRRCRSRS
jgi:pyruvate,water dikinase